MLRQIQPWSFRIQYEFNGGLEDILKRKYVLYKDEIEPVCELKEAEFSDLKEFIAGFEKPKQLEVK